jgi:hypothetical protein
VTVTVDDEPLAARELGLQTVGQVLSHLRTEKRLVVQILIDGSEPEVSELGAISGTKLDGHCIFIETANPRQLAAEVLDEIESQLLQSQTLKRVVADLLQTNQVPKAMENLGGCLSSWQNVRESLSKIVELLRLDLTEITVGRSTATAVMGNFSEKLRQIKQALEQRDYVLLGDVLMYEMADTDKQLLAAIDAVRQFVAAMD